MNALTDTLPVLPEQRQWRFVDFVWVQSGLAIATWGFLFGGVTAQFVGFWDGLWTMLIGNCLGVIVMIGGSIMLTTKWGVEQFVALRSIFGALGVLILVLGLLVPVTVGWSTILSIMFGRASVEVVNSLTGGASLDSIWVSIFGFAALVASWQIVVRGGRGVRLINRIVAPGLIFMSAVLFYMLLQQILFRELTASVPLAPTDDRSMNLMLALELNVAAGVSWWSVAGNIARGAQTQRAAVWGAMLGLVPVATLAQLVGLSSALTLGSSDPTTWLLPIVGPTLGALLLIFLALANLTSTANIVYASCQTFVQHLGRRFQDMGWTKVTGLLFCLSALMVFFTTTALYDGFFLFIAVSQAILVSVIGVVLVDYWVLRKTHLVRAQLYRLDEQGEYHFWCRFNPAPFVGLVSGMGVFLAMLDPISLTGSELFTKVSASLPALLLAGGVHGFLTVVWVRRSGKGGYRVG